MFFFIYSFITKYIINHVSICFHVYILFFEFVKNLSFGSNSDWIINILGARLPSGQKTVLRLVQRAQLNQESFERTNFRIKLCPAHLITKPQPPGFQWIMGVCVFETFHFLAGERPPMSPLCAVKQLRHLTELQAAIIRLVVLYDSVKMWLKSRQLHSVL